ncbi:hypothetical protein OQE50_26140 (plasmid) [Enterobacter kobei]|uniref:hypothetical protein n=1 Tax=Enterobacter kobei TaxID=208224 RepID=UPI00224A904B|nr:hypothetical protein [Enterobacter kobei]UZQ70468.1 hypothetical protein OQE50_26140 [Enterobacter kobei]
MISENDKFNDLTVNTSGWLADGINPGRERAGRDNNVTVNHQTNIKAAGIGACERSGK